MELNSLIDRALPDPGDPRHDSAADAAPQFGVIGAVAAAVTGLVQFLGTRNAARRETAAHAALNNVRARHVTSDPGRDGATWENASPRPQDSRPAVRTAARRPLTGHQDE